MILNLLVYLAVRVLSYLWQNLLSGIENFHTKEYFYPIQECLRWFLVMWGLDLLHFKSRLTCICTESFALRLSMWDLYLWTNGWYTISSSDLSPSVSIRDTNTHLYKYWIVGAISSSGGSSSDLVIFYFIHMLNQEVLPQWLQLFIPMNMLINNHHKNEFETPFILIIFHQTCSLKFIICEM